MSALLTRWNLLPREQAAKEILPCCGSTAWADGMASRRPFADEASLLSASDEVWRNLAKADWLEAFASHPRIGESGKASSPAKSSQWSMREQEKVAAGEDAVKRELADGNAEYEQRFGRIFIVCATGKSGTEILEILRRRLGNDEATELHEAAEQQRMITHIRLRKFLSE
jgi:2-oxo-4-hydroxy-4-carboxy-5-ureidoimidazoline decarboxylase